MCVVLLPFLILLVCRFYSSLALSNSQWCLSRSLGQSWGSRYPAGGSFPLLAPLTPTSWGANRTSPPKTSSLGLYRDVCNNFWVPVLTVPWLGSMGSGWRCGGCPWCWASYVSPLPLPWGEVGCSWGLAAVQSREHVLLQATASLFCHCRLKSCLPFFKAWI